MKRTLTLLAGGAVGYVLGARAGREHYESMKSTVKQSVKSGAGAASQRWPRDQFGKPVLNPRQIASARASSTTSGADLSVELPPSEPLAPMTPGMVEPGRF